MTFTFSLHENELTIKNLNEHPFHLVAPSFWPLMAAFSLYNFLLVIIGYLNSFSLFSITLDFVTWQCKIYSPILYFSLFVFVLYRWFSDIIREATYEGYHTSYVQTGIYYGIILFIVSEILFFFSFFWAFFHMSLSPNFFIGMFWPPEYINILDYTSLPLWNTIILLSSGVTVTYAHKACIAGARIIALDGLFWTIIYGSIFTLIQGYEYCYSNYSINDGVYGSIFFLLTGFHGLHVIIGTIFLSVSLYRLIDYHFTRQHHIGLEAAILYWHMVDAIWLLLFICLYL